MTLSSIDQYKMLRSIFQNTPFFRAKIGVPTSVILLGFVAAALSKPLSGYSEATPPTPLNARTQCHPGDPIWLSVPEDLVSISPLAPGILCAFRSKNGGFPTLNVLVHPRQHAPANEGQRERAEDLRESYNRVGLTDAVIINPHLQLVGGIPTFRATVRYSNRGAPMTSEVVTLDLPDRTYIATTTHTGETMPEALRSLLDSLSLDLVPSPPTEATGHGGASPSLRGTITVLALFLLLAMWLKRARQNR